MFPLDQSVVDQIMAPQLSKTEKQVFKKKPNIWQKKDIAYFFYLICRPKSQF